MSAHAAPAPTGPSFTIRGRPYPVLLPKLGDPRLHLAAVIISLQVIGQIGFHFELSIAQILLAIGTCAVLEVAIAMRQQHVILWPASATLTGNGVAFVLRVPGTVHGDWWSLNGWWIYVGTAAVSLLSKHVIRWRGEHIFNPSNIGLVLCFLLLGRTRAAPLDFWWGPMSAWLVLALAIIVAGGFLILRRLKLLRVALGFWASFAVAIGVLALAGHTMTARWHLGPISGFQLWWVLVTSPEVLVFLFFMITDPKTAPRSPTGRLVYAVSLGLLAGVMIAPTVTEYAAKVALLGSLAVVCLALPILRSVRWPLDRRLDRRLVVGIASAAVAVAAAAMVVGNAPAVADASPAVPPGKLPPITILPAQGVQTQLDLHTAQLIAHDLVAAKPSAGTRPLRIWLVQGVEQGPPTATVQQAGIMYHLHQTAGARWALPSAVQSVPVEAAPKSSALRGVRLTNVAPAVGLDFRQDSFRYGVSNDYTAMMGGGVCWLDYNGDGWEDLFAVNSYASSDAARFEAHGGLPRTQLFENLHGHFRNVTAASHAGLRVQGDGCAAADLNGDGRPDLIVTTATGIKLLWNNGNGTFTEGARAAGMTASGWYTGVAVADVNGDGRPDVFVAGYTRPYEPVPNSLAGFPTNLVGVRDLLYLNEGNGPNGRARFREVGVQAGLEASDFSHGLGATFLDVNGDGRPDLYVANDEDPNQLYVNVPWPGGAKADPAGLGFRFENRAAASGVADPYAGMGVAVDGAYGGPLDLVVTNSRHEPSAAFAATSSPSFTNARPDFDPALGADFAGWGDSFVDLRNSGSPDLMVATGGIPVTSLQKDAGPVKVVAPRSGKPGAYGVAEGVVPSGLRVNGRGLAAADVDNDGRLEIAVNSIGGKLLLLKPTGPTGHWLDVKLSRFDPGTVVTITLPDGRTLSQEERAGSSYL
ncbi:MAG: FG-GAP-like repeat-containing protein, partial [Gaiellaceae bacterium]